MGRYDMFTFQSHFYLCFRVPPIVPAVGEIPPSGLCLTEKTNDLEPQPPRARRVRGHEVRAAPSKLGLRHRARSLSIWLRPPCWNVDQHGPRRQNVGDVKVNPNHTNSPPNSPSGILYFEIYYVTNYTSLFNRGALKGNPPPLLLRELNIHWT